MVKKKETGIVEELENALEEVANVDLGEAVEELEETVVDSVGKGLEEFGEAKIEEKKENVKQDKQDKQDSEKKKVESKPAVAKTKDDKKSKVKKGEGVTELEREYIVPMRKGFMNVPHYRRAKKAVKTLKEFMVKHMNVRDNDTRKIKVDINLNNEIWFRGIKNPLHKVKVLAKKVDGIVYVTLADPADYVKFKMARDAKKKALTAPKEKGLKSKGKIEEKDVDKDKDGVVDAVEEREDAEAEAEKDIKNAKIDAKAEQHTATGKHTQQFASEKTLK
ncbi:MAG: hypothetical protein V1888_01190 [archaeon]